ncbi:hypothetical protein [Galactobacter caseinivorans]|uniref:hypothetical protein n=1 Tax=Galactobacter caseinivorans TaxID=2676123 RepID=UPI0018F6D6F1|nr:hypothetical protein [Galactobacter caseinivorans]
MIVITIDQRDSRRREDEVPALITSLAGVPTVRPFQRTAGDEVQAVLDDAGAAIGVALSLGAGGRWSVGLGVGRVHLPLPAETRAGSGEAFEAARVAVERAKTLSGRIGVVVPSDPAEAARLQAELSLLSLTLARRTPQQAEAAALRSAGSTQAQIAERLGISQQAVSSRLAAGQVEEAAALVESVVPALERTLTALAAGPAEKRDRLGEASERGVGGQS